MVWKTRSPNLTKEQHLKKDEEYRLKRDRDFRVRNQEEKNKEMIRQINKALGLHIGYKKYDPFVHR